MVRGEKGGRTQYRVALRMRWGGGGRERDRVNNHEAPGKEVTSKPILSSGCAFFSSYPSLALCSPSWQSPGKGEGTYDRRCYVCRLRWLGCPLPVEPWRCGSAEEPHHTLPALPAWSPRSALPAAANERGSCCITAGPCTSSQLWTASHFSLEVATSSPSHPTL